MQNFFSGIDLGSSYSKAVLINDQKKTIAEAVIKTGLSFEKASEDVFHLVLGSAKLKKDQVKTVVATGVGRNNCPFSAFSKPEIICLTKGGFHYFPDESFLVDIGGQDNKIIKISKDGTQMYFKMNRKCAAGTGSFLEEISSRLNTSLQKMNELAEKTDKTVKLGSYCTVFTGSEIIHHIRTGKDLNEIIRGVFESMVKRILEMDQLTGKVVLSGGAVANNPVLVTLFKENVSDSDEVVLPPSPQMLGAFGAALYAKEK